MAVVDRETLKTWFERLDKPTQSQFASLIDSMLHKNDQIPLNSIPGLTALLDEKADAEAVSSVLEQLAGIIEEVNIHGEELEAMSQYINLPVPQVKLISNQVPIQYVVKAEAQSADIVYDDDDAKINLLNAPVITVQDFTQKQLDSGLIFLEMLHYRRMTKKKGAVNSAGFVSAGANVHDWDLPWSHHSVVRNSSGTLSPGGFELLAPRINFMRVTDLYQKIPVYQMLHNRFHEDTVAYRDIEEEQLYQDIIIPSVGYNRAGKNRPTNKFPYSARLTPYYVAFRYFRYHPVDNSFSSGPLSTIVKITFKHHPFVKIPGAKICAELNPYWLDEKHIYKCDTVDRI